MGWLRSQLRAWMLLGAMFSTLLGSGVSSAQDEGLVCVHVSYYLLGDPEEGPYGDCAGNDVGEWQAGSPCFGHESMAKACVAYSIDDPT